MRTASPTAKLFVVIAVAAVMAALVLLHVAWVNGSPFWVWPWQRAPAVRWYGFMLIAAIPAIVALFIDATSRIKLIACIALLMISTVALKLATQIAPEDGFNLSRLATAVRDPLVTSYFTDAAPLSTHDDWLAVYPYVLVHMQLHTMSKPPGPVGFYMQFIHAFGETDAAATRAGIVLAILSALSLPAVWWLVKLLTDSSQTGLGAAKLLALSPGFVVVFPAFDSFYTAIACVMIATWHLAVVRDRKAGSIALGATLALACFCSYSLLAIGFFMALYPFVRRDAPSALVLRRFALHAAIALATMVGIYAVFWCFTYFEPIATFRSAYWNQQQLLKVYGQRRPYPYTIPTDLLDFLIGVGWIGALLSIFFLVRARGQLLWIGLLGIAQIIVTALSGQLQCETTRVWNFLVPLLLISAAGEWASWPRTHRIVAAMAMLMMTMVIGQNMIFMPP
jgi:hypothetical protein